MNSFSAILGSQSARRAIRLVCCIVSGLLAKGIDAAETPESPPMVEIQARFFRADPARISSVVPTSGTGGVQGVFSTATQLDGMLIALKAAGAEFFSNHRTITKSGEAARLESVRELSYPVKWSNAEDAGKPVPIKFATRNVGTTLDCTPTAGPADQIEVAFAAEIVGFRGFVDYANPKSPDDFDNSAKVEALLQAPLKDGGIWQPIFSVQKTTSDVTLYSGQTLLLRFLAEQDLSPNASAKNEKKSDSTYMFVTARILPEDQPK